MYPAYNTLEADMRKEDCDMITLTFPVYSVSQC